MKLKIFLLTFGVPVLLFIVFLIVSRDSSKQGNLIIGFLLVIGTIAKVLLVKRKYVASFIINESNLDINYFTPYLKRKFIALPISEIADTELTKSNLIAEYPAAVNIKCKNKWLTFEIIEKKLFKEIQNKLAVANIGFANVR